MLAVSSRGDSTFTDLQAFLHTTRNGKGCNFIARALVGSFDLAMHSFCLQTGCLPSLYSAHSAIPPSAKQWRASPVTRSLAHSP